MSSAPNPNDSSSDDEGPDNIWIASSNGDILRVQQLLKEGMSINSQDEVGYSPMHAAVSYGHMELIKLLLAAGADVNIEDMDGDTPLLVCEDPEVFDYLLQNGADLKKVNQQGWGIFEKVIDDDNETMMKHLLLHGFTDNPELIAQMMEFVGTSQGDEEEEGDDENEAETT